MFNKYIFGLPVSKKTLVLLVINIKSGSVHIFIQCMNFVCYTNRYIHTNKLPIKLKLIHCEL